jgi:hypothetical protein
MTNVDKTPRHYAAMIDSCDLIAGYIAGHYLGRDIIKNQDAIDTVSRNVEHLKIMQAKDIWSGYDLTPIATAIANGEAYLS